MDKVDVVMPVWATDEDTVALTKNAVESLRETADIRLIIIDNGSTIGGGLMRQWADVYVRNKENLGYAKAVNQGLQLSNMYVAVANNDIRVSPRWWDTAWELLQDPTVASVHYRMIPYEQPFNPGVTDWIEGRERWCSGSFFVVRNIQLYDEVFLNSYDDWDYFYRFRKNGFKTAYTSRAEYQHLDSWTQQKVIERSENEKRNREYFKEKHGEYAEDIFARMYPGQMAEPYKPMP